MKGECYLGRALALPTKRCGGCRCNLYRYIASEHLNDPDQVVEIWAPGENAGAEAYAKTLTEDEPVTDDGPSVDVYAVTPDGQIGQRYRTTFRLVVQVVTLSLPATKGA